MVVMGIDFSIGMINGPMTKIRMAKIYTRLAKLLLEQQYISLLAKWKLVQ